MSIKVRQVVVLRSARTTERVRILGTEGGLVRVEAERGRHLLVHRSVLYQSDGKTPLVLPESVKRQRRRSVKR